MYNSLPAEAVGLGIRTPTVNYLLRELPAQPMIPPPVHPTSAHIVLKRSGRIPLDQGFSRQSLEFHSTEPSPDS